MKNTPSETLPVWDLEAIYANEELWQQDFEKIRPRSRKIRLFQRTFERLP